MKPKAYDKLDRAITESSSSLRPYTNRIGIFHCWRCATLESLAVVGAIVTIRAALTYLLNRELKDETERG